LQILHCISKLSKKEKDVESMNANKKHLRDDCAWSMAVIVSTLENPNAGSADLHELIGETEQAIAAADEVIASERAAAADLISTPSADASQQAISRAEAATINRTRLSGVLPKLRDKLTATLASERPAKWLGFYETANAERQKLAHEIDTTRARVKAELGSLNRRLKECNAECRSINDMALDIGEYREIEMLPLFAAVRTGDADTSSTEPNWQAANVSRLPLRHR
jgi:hypothetical protein